MGVILNAIAAERAMESKVIPAMIHLYVSRNRKTSSRLMASSCWAGDRVGTKYGAGLCGALVSVALKLGLILQVDALGFHHGLEELARCSCCFGI